jgi:Mrp family chromosome partitioning ATPase
VLPAGTIPPNPQELLGRESFGSLIRDLGHEYDVILIDTPPAGQVADAQAIVPYVKGVLLLARAHRTRLAGIRQLAARLKDARGEIIGVVMNEP